MTVYQWSIIFAVVASSISYATNYEGLAGHQIWRLNGKNSAVPSELMKEGLLDVFDHSGPSRQVRVASQHAKKVHDIFKQQGVPYEVLVHDLATHFKAEELRERRTRDLTTASQTCTESQCAKPLDSEYMTFQQMEWYLQSLGATKSSKLSISSIGKSHEERDIWLVNIKSDNLSAKSIWIEGGLHAREWISPAVAFGLIDKLVNDNNITNKFNFFIAPMANPDGYYYTWTKDRFWRKNRRINNGSTCAGVDLNRNWDFHYGVGASTNPCSEVFMGPSAFSEPETQALRDAMTKEKDNLLLVVALHSYGQDLLYPWGWSHTAAPPNKQELIAAGNVFAKGAFINGKHYSVINSAGGLYYASGATDDWTLGVLKTKYVYTLELRDDGSRGFALGATDIQPSVEEVWNGLKKLLDHIA